MSEQTGRMTKQALLDSIHAGRQRLETTLAGLDAGQMLQPGAEGAWSVKDILVHIAYWEEELIGWLETAQRGEVPADLAAGFTEEGLDRLNAAVYQQHRDRPLDEVLAEFGSSYQAMLRVIERTPEQDLVDPDRFAWRQGEPLWKPVAGTTYWHYDEHRDSIRAWLEET
jgi:hypothetical protein